MVSLKGERNGLQKMLEVCDGEVCRKELAVKCRVVCLYLAEFSAKKGKGSRTIIDDLLQNSSYGYVAGIHGKQ